MKSNNIALALTIVASSLALAQEVKKYEPITFEPGSTYVRSFTNEERKFNDWSVSFGGGIPLVQSADITSINNGNGKGNVGYAFYLSVDKAITHAVGLSLQYDKGQTKQSSEDGKKYRGKTDFDAVSLLADINFSNLFRRVDNRSPYRWAFHGYAGVGLLAYKAKLSQNGGAYETQTEVKPFTTGSIAFQAGAGVKYKINRRFDLGLRGMYVLTHSDSFDGGGAQYSNINMREEQASDNFFNFNFGVTYKIGKHISHLMWHDPLQEIYHRLDKAPKSDVLEVCQKGDNDNDGVCDDWDKELDTPAGARVDGSGIALDADMDGVIDLYDKCVTIPGPADNHGCPKEEPKPVAVVADYKDIASQLERALEGVVFNFNRGDQVKEESLVKLDLAADIIKSSKGGTYLITGHTDKKGNDVYNLKLSRERAKTVVQELEKRGVKASQLKSKGVGEKFAKVPETATDLERLKDRKVTVEYVSGAEWDALPKSDVK